MACRMMAADRPAYTEEIPSVFTMWVSRAGKLGFFVSGDMDPSSWIRTYWVFRFSFSVFRRRRRVSSKQQRTEQVGAIVVDVVLSGSAQEQTEGSGGNGKKGE